MAASRHLWAADPLSGAGDFTAGAGRQPGGTGTGHSIYHRGWESTWFRKGFPDGEVPLEAIAGVEIATIAARGRVTPLLAVWLTDPSGYRLGRGILQFLGQLAGVGDLEIDCSETDCSAEQIKEAIEAALNSLSPSGERVGERGL